MKNIMSIPLELKVYKKRWLILASFFTIFFWTILHTAIYGVVNNIVVRYFDTSFAVTDWLTLACQVGTILASPTLAWLSLKQIISCRKLMIFSSLCLILNSSCSILAFNKPSLFALLLLGQTLNGISIASCLTVMTCFASLWFPESQIGIAVGLIFLSGTLGTFVANSVLPAAIELPTSNKTMIQLHSLSQNESVTDLWVDHNKSVFTDVFSLELVTTFVVLVYLIGFVPEKPDKAPSYAQYLKQSSSNFMNQTKSNANMKDFLGGVKALLTDKVFVLCAISSGITFYIIDLEMIVMEQIMQENFRQSAMTADLQAGLVIVCFNIGNIIGNPISGKLLDHFKRYYIQSCFGAACYTLCAIGASLSICYSFISTVFVFYFLSGIFSRISIISLVDSVTQHTYPRDIIFVSSWMTLLQAMHVPLLAVISRLIFKHFQVIGVLIFFCLLKLLSFSFVVLGKPKLHRLNAEQSQSIDAAHEETRLVQN